MNGSLWNDEQQKPLQHLRVVDLTVMLPGPYVTRLLSQYGADVVKVEHLPNGDPTRNLENTKLFELLNQGKRSVALNLDTPKGVELVKRMAGEADVFIESFREGVMEGYGLDYASISEENPDLIYVSLRGLSGKNANKPAHDLNFVAASGVGEWFLESGAPNYSTVFGDLVGGALVPTMKLLFHLANPARHGMHLICPMDEGFRSLYLHRAFDFLKSERLSENERKDFGLTSQMDGSRPHSRYYHCRDGGWVALNAIQTRHWENFCDVVDRAQWKNRAQDLSLVPELEKLFLDAPASYWEALATNRECCLFRVLPWTEHLASGNARTQLTSDPFAWAGFVPNGSLGPAPALGADTFSVINQLGVSSKELTEDQQNGVVFQPDAKAAK